MDVSLYNLALSVKRPPQPMSVSPATLLSLVGSVIDLLVEQQISATLWIKLPPGEIWQAEIQRYHEQVGVSHAIYSCNLYPESAPSVLGRHKEESAASVMQSEQYGGSQRNYRGEVNQDLDREAEIADKPAPTSSGLKGFNMTRKSSALEAHKADSDQLSLVQESPSLSNGNHQTEHPGEVVNGVASSQSGGKGIQSCPNYPVVTVYLAPTSKLRREYFLLVLSPQFCSLILAHRPLIRRQTGTRKKADQKRTQPLVAVCSFEGRVIQRALDGIKQAIAQSASSQSQTTPTDLLANWDSRVGYPTAPDSVLLSKLLAKQIQQHDETRRSATTEHAAAWQLQNQELLNTLSLKDEFLNNLCQELRTPLTNMKTALSLLNSPQLKPPQRQRYLQLLNTECDRQSSLITGLLDLVQLGRESEQTVLQPVRLSDIVPGVVSTYQPLAQEKGIMLAYTVPIDLPAISCVSAWVKQIVINLLHNSIKFTPTGGQVWVRSRLQGDYVQLEFRDTGIGIANSEIPKIFDRFYRVRPIAGEDPGGAGLGLTIVQQLLQRCGGSISVKSKLGEGSTFNVLLPVISNSERDSRVSPAALS